MSQRLTIDVHMFAEQWMCVDDRLKGYNEPLKWLASWRINPPVKETSYFFCSLRNKVSKTNEWQSEVRESTQANRLSWMWLPHCQHRPAGV